jgi:hypothetical protein
MLMEIVGRRVSMGVLWDPSTGGYQSFGRAEKNGLCDAGRQRHRAALREAQFFRGQRQRVIDGTRSRHGSRETAASPPPIDAE